MKWVELAATALLVMKGTVVVEGEGILRCLDSLTLLQLSGHCQPQLLAKVLESFCG